MIYASNQRPGSYTGFYKPISKPNTFDRHRFLTQYALPGPGSVVHCIIQKDGPTASTIKQTLKKDQAVSHIPGLLYRPTEISNIVKLPTWTSSPMPVEVTKSIDLEEVGAAEQYHPLDLEPEAEDVANELSMKEVIQHCDLHKIVQWSELSSAPPHIQLLMAKPGYKRKI